MTHPTKAIVSTLLRDFISVSRGGADEGLYNAKDLDAALAATQVIDFHQTLDLDGIKVRPSPHPGPAAPPGGTPCNLQHRFASAVRIAARDHFRGWF